MWCCLLYCICIYMFLLNFYDEEKELFILFVWLKIVVLMFKVFMDEDFWVLFFYLWICLFFFFGLFVYCLFCGGLEGGWFGLVDGWLLWLMWYLFLLLYMYMWMDMVDRMGERDWFGGGGDFGIYSFVCFYC